MCVFHSHISIKMSYYHSFSTFFLSFMTYITFYITKCIYYFINHIRIIYYDMYHS